MTKPPAEAPKASPAAGRLDSWKEIASYLKRGVRSVQRWEAEEGMPVHRHVHSKGGTVSALPSELDAWWKERGSVLSARNGAEDSDAPASEPGEAAERASEPVTPHRRQSRRVLWAAAGFSAAVMALGVIAWLSRDRWGPASGTLRTLPFEARDWVLVAGFENRTGEALFDGTLDYALERELANSRYVNVVSRERIRDALRLMRKPLDTQVDAVIGREICLRDGGIRALITGRIEKFGQKYVLSLELVDQGQGAQVASVAEESARDDGLLEATRRVSNRVRTLLGESPPLTPPGEGSLLKVTTPSLGALQLYSRADDLIAQGNSAAAEELLKQAVAEDPEFASAHAHLAHAIRNQGRPMEDFLPAAETAYRLSERTTERERYFIRGSYYDFLGEKEKAVAAYEALVSLYPDHFWGTNNLMGYYEDLGRDREAADSAVRRADLRPMDFETNVRAAELLTRFEPDGPRAKQLVRRTRELVSPSVMLDFTGEVGWLELLPAYELWMEGDAAGAAAIAARFQREVEALPAPPNDSAFVELGAFFQTIGRLRTAEEFFNRLPPPSNHLLVLSLIRGNPKELKPQSRIPVVHPDSVDPYVVVYLARSGLVGQAERALAEKEPLLTRPGVLDALRGEVAMARGRTAEGIRYLTESLEKTRRLGRTGSWFARETLASALAAQGDLEGAIRILEEGSARKRNAAFWWVSQGALWTRNQLLLARMYRKAGRPAVAQKIEAELSQLLALADADHPILLELRRLQGS